MRNSIELFVMQGCHVCPQMERTFQALQQQGEIDNLQIIDVSEQPELARQHNIRSVPHYIINGIAFSGLKSREEILSIVQSSTDHLLLRWMREQLTEGQLSDVELMVSKKSAARQALLILLNDLDTSLVVRIGLTAIIESLAQDHIFDDMEQRFIKLVEHHEQRIAIDALYYLQLISTPGCQQKLLEIAETGSSELSQLAHELILESSIGERRH